MKRGRIDINNADDYNCIIDDMLSEFIETFTIENGLVSKVTQEHLELSDEYKFGGYVFTTKGDQLYDRACRRYYKLGLKYFHADELYIKSSNLIIP